MRYHVTKVGAGPKAGYEVRQSEPNGEAGGVVQSFRARRLPPNPKWGACMEQDFQVRARAQALVNRLKAGGIAGERALRDAQADEEQGP